MIDEHEHLKQAINENVRLVEDVESVNVLDVVEDIDNHCQAEGHVEGFGGALDLDGIVTYAQYQSNTTKNNHI